MEKIEMREHKLVFYVGIIYCFIFSFFLILFIHICIQDHDLSSLIFYFIIFGIFDSFGVYILLSYYRRKFIFYEDYLIYTPSIGKTKTIRYQDIQVIQSKGEKCKIISHDGRKVACFESNMKGFPTALHYLLKKGIEFKIVEK